MKTKLTDKQRRVLKFAIIDAYLSIEYQGRDHIIGLVIFEGETYEFPMQTFKSLTIRGLLRKFKTVRYGEWWAEINRHRFKITSLGKEALNES